jgi:hypothetical protein
MLERPLARTTTAGITDRCKVSGRRAVVGALVIFFVSTGCGKHRSRIDSGIEETRGLATLTEEEGDHICNVSMEFMEENSRLDHQYCMSAAVRAGEVGTTTETVRNLCHAKYDECMGSIDPAQVLDLWQDSIICFDRLPPSSQCQTTVGAVEDCYTDAANAMAETELPCDRLSPESYPVDPLLMRPASCTQVVADCAEIF